MTKHNNGGSKMKKLIAVSLILAVVFASGFASAVVVRSITDSRIIGMVIDIERDGADITNIFLTSKSITIDSQGRRAGDEVRRTQFNDLPANLQAGITNLIKFEGRELSKQGANEDVETTVPATMPGRGNR
jgi:hypothetical protein